MSSTEFNNISFDMPKSQSNTIKVIGVGGGGSNAVNYMFKQSTKGIDFVICNTDAQALENSPIPNKIQLGASLTSGLGAGANPEIGEEAAIESLEEIKNVLTTQTKMVFITAGMGGGTGTGAAPIIAKIAKDSDILTVGIVTIPFQFEGRMRAKQAQKGVDALKEHVDSLIVINNNKLREVYGNLGFKAGFSKADEVLSTASRGIAEVITHHYKQNIDLHDAKTVLSNSGTAIMGSAKESGSNRAKNAIVKALDSPLLNDNKITGAKNVLLLVISGRVEVTLDEIGEINDFIQVEAGYDANIIMGVGEDESLEEAIAVTVVATGFASEQQSDITNTEVKRIIHTLEDEQKAVYDFEEKQSLQQEVSFTDFETVHTEKKIVHHLEEEEETSNTIVKTTPFIENLEVVCETFIDELPDESLAPIEKEIPLEEAAFLDTEDFVIKEVVSEIDTPKETVLELEPTSASSQMDLLFDLPLSKSSSNQDKETTPPVYFDLEESISDTIKEMEVYDHIEVKNTLKEEDVKRYVLEDIDLSDVNEMEVRDHIEVKNLSSKTTSYSTETFKDVQPTIKNASTINVNDKEKEVEVSGAEQIEELVFTVKTEENISINDMEVFDAKEVSPLDLTIAELQKRSENRRQKMKKFNYKFLKNSHQNVEEIENQPAYKRMGIDLEESNPSEEIQSRTTLGVDDNDEIQLRSNNSFLHDNVD